MKSWEVRLTKIVVQEHDDLLMEKFLEEFYYDIEKIKREDKSIAKFLKLWKEKCHMIC